MNVIKKHLNKGHPGRPGNKLKELKTIVIHWICNRPEGTCDGVYTTFYNGEGTSAHYVIGHGPIRGSYFSDKLWSDKEKEAVKALGANPTHFEIVQALRLLQPVQVMEIVPPSEVAGHVRVRKKYALARTKEIFGEDVCDIEGQNLYSIGIELIPIYVKRVYGERYDKDGKEIKELSEGGKFSKGTLDAAKRLCVNLMLEYGGDSPKDIVLTYHSEIDGRALLPPTSEEKKYCPEPWLQDPSQAKEFFDEVYKLLEFGECPWFTQKIEVTGEKGVPNSWEAFIKDVLSRRRAERWSPETKITDEMAFKALMEWNPDYFDEDGEYMKRGKLERPIKKMKHLTAPVLYKGDVITIRHPFQEAYLDVDEVKT